jgi:hypothetical protein
VRDGDKPALAMMSSRVKEGLKIAPALPICQIANLVAYAHMRSGLTAFGEKVVGESAEPFTRGLNLASKKVS